MLLKRFASTLVFLLMVFVLRQSVTAQSATWSTAEVDYLGMRFEYPVTWTLQPQPYIDFGFRLNAPNLSVDPMGRPLTSGFVTAFTEIATPEAWNALLTSAVWTPTTAAGVIAYTAVFTPQYEAPYQDWVFYANDRIHTLRFVATASDFTPLLEDARAIVARVTLTGSYAPIPQPPAFNSALIAPTIPDLLFPFPAGQGKIVSGYNNGTSHIGAELYGLDFCEGSGCTQSAIDDLVLAPTTITYRYVTRGFSMPSYSKDFHFFQLTDNYGGLKLCLTMGHLNVTLTGFVIGSTITRGTHFGRIIAYTPSINHIHMAMYTVPQNSQCESTSGRIHVPFDSTRGGLKLDGTDYAAPDALPQNYHRGTVITSTNAGQCAPPTAAADVVTFDAGCDTPPANTLFSDNFNDGNYNGWNVSTGSWDVTGGSLHSIQACGGLPIGIITTGDPSWTDYEFSFDIQHLQGWDGGQAIFRNADNSYYLLETHPNIAYGGKIRLYRIYLTPTYHSVLLIEMFWSTPNQTWRRFTIRAHGSHIQLFDVSGATPQTVFDYYDAEPLLHGGIGFRMGAGAICPTEVVFDNVLVTAVPSATPVTPQGAVAVSQPTFAWTSVGAGAWYYLWLNDAQGRVLDQWYDGWNICDATQCTVTLGINLPPGSYRWWLQSWTPTGGNSDWSAETNFAVVTPAVPTAPIGTITETQPTFTWQGTVGSAWYYLWIEGPGGKVLDQWYDGFGICSDGTCSVQPPLDLAGGTYYWWVQLWFPQGGYAPWSAATPFVVALPPATPSLIAPSGAITTPLPIFQWNHVPSVGWYYLWLSDENGHILDQWFNAYDICGGQSCQLPSPVTLPNGNYRWWIQGWSAEGGYGAWSLPGNFSVNAALPAAVTPEASGRDITLPANPIVPTEEAESP